jgi:branched-subunit amino acid aminotransferase/4-amino-4-deoxychorismate lyase
MDRELTNAALYGESVFTSFRISRSGIFLWERHFERLLKGICYLFFQREVQSQDQELFQKKLHYFYQNIETLNRAENFYCRLTFYRPAYVFARPCESWEEIHCNLMFRVLPDNGRTELKTAFSEWLLPPRYWPADFKKDDYSLRQIERQKNNTVNDVLFLSDKKKLIEASTSNILLAQNGKFIIPESSLYSYQGLELEGVKEFLSSTGKSVKVQAVDTKFLKMCEAMWLINSVKLLQPVSQVLNHVDFSDQNSYLEWENQYKEYRDSKCQWPKQ